MPLVEKFMIQAIKHRIILTLIFFTLFGTTKTFACDCPLLTTEQAVEKSKAVFSGKVVGFEYRKGIPNEYIDEQAKETGKTIDYETLFIKVRVNQWWKGEPPTEIYLLTTKTRNADGTSTESSCDFILHEGETYLIFASKFNTKGENEYRTSDCMRTRKFSAASDDLKILGKGKSPSKKENEADKSLDMEAKQRLSKSLKNDPFYTIKKHKKRL
jgi:hypothetical protein